MSGFAPSRNQNVPSRVCLSDNFCKETAPCLTNIAPPSVTRQHRNQITSALSSAVWWWRSVCFCGSSWATAFQRALTTATAQPMSRLKRPPLQPLPSLRLQRQPRLMQLRLLQRLPHLRQQLRLLHNHAGLRALTDLTILGGCRRVPALFSFAQAGQFFTGCQSAAPKLPTGMTLC